jgi:lipoxygenase
VFPPVSSGGKKSSITAAHIEGQLEGRTVEKVIVIPFLKKMQGTIFIMSFFRE